MDEEKLPSMANAVRTEDAGKGKLSQKDAAVARKASKEAKAQAAMEAAAREKEAREAARNARAALSARVSEIDDLVSNVMAPEPRDIAGLWQSERDASVEEELHAKASMFSSRVKDLLDADSVLAVGGDPKALANRLLQAVLSRVRQKIDVPKKKGKAAAKGGPPPPPASAVYQPDSARCHRHCLDALCSTCGHLLSASNLETLRGYRSAADVAVEKKWAAVAAEAAEVERAAQKAKEDEERQVRWRQVQRDERERLEQERIIQMINEGENATSSHESTSGGGAGAAAGTSASTFAVSGQKRVEDMTEEEQFMAAIMASEQTVDGWQQAPVEAFPASKQDAPTPPPEPTCTEPPKPTRRVEEMTEEEQIMHALAMAACDDSAAGAAQPTPTSAHSLAPGLTWLQEQQQQRQQQQAPPHREVPNARGVNWPRRQAAATEAAQVLEFNLTVPDLFVRHIIGKQGAVIKRLQEQTKCAVVVPAGPDPSDPAVRTLSLSSTSTASCEAAAAEIERIVQQVQQLESRQKQGDLPRASGFEQEQHEREYNNSYGAAQAPLNRGAVGGGGARNEPQAFHSEPRNEPRDKWSDLEQHMQSGAPTAGGGYVPPHLRRLRAQEEEARVAASLPQQAVSQPLNTMHPREVALSVESLTDLAVLLEFKEEHAYALMSSGYELHSLKTSSDETLKQIGLPKGVRMKVLKWAQEMSST